MDQYGTRPCRALRIFRTLLAMLAVGFLGMFLFCAGGGVLLVWGAQRAVVHMNAEIAEAQRQQQLQAVRATASAFVHELAAGESARAYGRLSRAHRERESLTEWQDSLSINPMGKGLREGELQVTSFASADLKKCRVILVTGGGFEVGAVMDMVKDDGHWTVDRLILH